MILPDLLLLLLSHTLSFESKIILYVKVFVIPINSTSLDALLAIKELVK